MQVDWLMEAYNYMAVILSFHLKCGGRETCFVNLPDQLADVSASEQTAFMPKTAGWLLESW